jgi:hypothetical protein
VALRVGPELADPLGSLQVGEHRGAGPRASSRFRSWPSAPCLSSRRCGILIPEAKDRTLVR